MEIGIFLELLYDFLSFILLILQFFDVKIFILFLTKLLSLLINLLEFILELCGEFIILLKLLFLSEPNILSNIFCS